MRSLPSLSLLSAAAAVALIAAGCATSKPKPTITIEDIMKEGFKGTNSIAAHIGKNMATEGEKMRMVVLTQQLALNAPPKGDLADWTARTTQLNQAAVAVESNLPGSLESWRAAVDCKACHTAHKPD